MAHKHVFILGGGVVGLCSALFAARRGWRVTVAERGAATRDGCSYGNAGMIVPSHFVPLAAPGVVGTALKWMWNPRSPLYIRPRLDAELFSWSWKFLRSANAAHVVRCAPLLRDLSFASRALFEDFTDKEKADFGLTRRGLLMLCHTAHALDEEARGAEQARALGVPAEVCDAHRVADLDPDVKMNVQGGVFYPKDCHLEPDRLMSWLQEKLTALGVEFLWNAEVTGFDTEGRRLRAARLARDTVEADEFVLCAGSWSPGIARGLGLRLPMQAGKGYSLTLARPTRLPQLCSILVESRVAVTPMGGRLRFGGTMEIAGLDESITAARVQGIVAAATRYFPEFREGDFEGVPPWRGLRPVSPDGMPYMGRSGRMENLTLATGHAMMGLSLGPVTGQIVGALLDGETVPWNLAPLAPERFG